MRASTDHDAFKLLSELTQEVCSRLDRCERAGRTICLKLLEAVKGANDMQRKGHVGHGVCHHHTRSVTLMQPAHSVEMILPQVKRLYNELNIAPLDLRGVGISISKLEKPGKPTARLHTFKRQRLDISADVLKSEEWNQCTTEQLVTRLDDDLIALMHSMLDCESAEDTMHKALDTLNVRCS